MPSFSHGLCFFFILSSPFYQIMPTIKGQHVLFQHRSVVLAGGLNLPVIQGVVPKP